MVILDRSILIQHPYMINYDTQRLAFLSLPITPEDKIPQDSQTVIIVAAVSVASLVLLGLGIYLFKKKRDQNNQLRQ